MLSADHFTVSTTSAPTVTGLATTSGSTVGGTAVTISGTHLTGPIAVYFGTVAATGVTVNSDSSITAIAPPETAGTVDITVQTWSGTSATSSADEFTYDAGAAPVVSGLSASSVSAAGGEAVTVYGSNFTAATSVGIYNGSTLLTSIPYFLFNGNSSLTFTVPMLPAGTFDVRITTTSGTSTAVSADELTVTGVTESTPVVSSVSPNTGSGSGSGASVTITGQYFTGATSVTFGGVSASYTILSDTQILATAPTHSSATVDVVVTTGNGTSATSSADEYTFTSTAAPTVTGLGTTSGTMDGGTSVTITGTNFTSGSTVTFGGVAATSVTYTSSTSLTATAPAGVPGPVDVVVTTANGMSATTSADQFTYLAPSAPTLSSLGTSTGTTAGGTSVSITGTHFQDVLGVFFGGVAATYTVNSTTSITATAPPQAAGTYDVTVSTYGGTSALSTSDRFAVSVASAPTVSSLGTSSGSTAGGTSVSITGTNLTGATNVFFGDVPATSFTIVSSTSITAISPSLPAGTVDITVSTFAGSSVTSSADLFTFNAASAPTVTGLSASSGTTGGGTTVTITGTNLTAATAVNFGSVLAASFTVNSATSITAVSPPQASGTVDVTVVTLGGTSATSSSDHYTFNAASSPAVTAVYPSSGSVAGGTVVTVIGSNFTGTSAVSFGSVAATSFTVLSDGVLVATAPAEAAATVDVTLTTPTGTSSTSSADHFTFDSVTAPSITSLGTTSGSTGGGTSVTINGSGFTGATGVTFGGVAATSFVVDSASAIQAISPADYTGTFDVQVDGQAGTFSALSSADRYTYLAVAAPVVTGLGTSSGSTAGGTSVTITGTNFSGASAVTFGGVPATFTINSDSSLTATAHGGGGRHGGYRRDHSHGHVGTVLVG